MIYQTKVTKEAMIKAGFDKSDLRVRTEFDRSVGGYGTTTITNYADRREQFSRIDDCLANGINVMLVKWDGAPDGHPFYTPHYSRSSTDQGKLEIHDPSKAWDDGRWTEYPSYAWVICHKNLI